MKTFIAALIGSLLSISVPAWAVLGQKEESVRADQQRLHGELLSVARQGYTVHQIKSPDGTVVKEFVSPAGMVFGISWQAPMLPKLSDLLGTYFQEFQKASFTGVHLRGPLVVRTGQLVVESGGHMRDFRGRAYLPSLMPENLAPEVVQ